MDREKMVDEIATCFCGYHDDENDKCKFYLHRPLCKAMNCYYRRKTADIVNKHIPKKFDGDKDCQSNNENFGGVYQ